MSELVKYSYKLNTLSSVILSPRAQSGFYYEIDYQKMDFEKNLQEDIPKIIYPFYQYGSYEKYNPHNAQYYIPGSSMKGAMQAGNVSKFLVDDIKVLNQDIYLKKLYKVQQISPKDTVDTSRKGMEIEAFFPKIKVEVLGANKEYSGEFWLPQNFGLEALLREIKISTERKMQRGIEIIESILSEKELPKELKCRELLEKMRNELGSLCQSSKESDRNEAFLLLGGYKGLALAHSAEIDMNKISEFSIYIDQEKKLPNGLVKLSF
jgi:hypothetical protein